jgi:hypothetical protein
MTSYDTTAWSSVLAAPRSRTQLIATHRRPLSGLSAVSGYPIPVECPYRGSNARHLASAVEAKTVGRIAELNRQPAGRALCIALVLLTLGLFGCGGTANSSVVVRVGDRSFSKGVVDHWVGVIKRGGAFSGFRGTPTGTPTQRAVALLVSSASLIGEAARQGVPVAEGVVAETLQQREHEGAGFQRRLRKTGQTIADVVLEIKAELAAEAIRGELASRAARITPQEALSFYWSNRALFMTPEKRIVDAVENEPSVSAAKALTNRLGAGRRFATVAHRKSIARGPSLMLGPEERRVADAVFAARPGAVSPPVPLEHKWIVFVVRKTIKGRPEPFAKIHAELLTLIDRRRQHEIAARFDREYKKFWSSQTTCARDYVAPGCPQFSGQLGAYEDPFSSRAHPLLSERQVVG